MSKLNLHETIRPKYCIAPVAVGTTGTGLTGKVIDRKGYNGVEFVIAYGAITATNATVTITMLEGDVTGTMTSVADADMVGTELLASIVAATPRTTTAGNSKPVKRIGYTGKKRYVTIKEVPTITAAATISVSAILHTPDLAATANP